jgi:hypothetical protein
MHGNRVQKGTETRWNCAVKGLAELIEATLRTSGPLARGGWSLLILRFVILDLDFVLHIRRYPVSPVDLSV